MFVRSFMRPDVGSHKPWPPCNIHPKLMKGLHRDLAAWQPHSITRFALDTSASSVLREDDITAAFGIYNNTLYWLNPQAHPRPRNPHLYAVADDLRALLSLHRGVLHQEVSHEFLHPTATIMPCRSAKCGVSSQRRRLPKSDSARAN